MKTHENRALFSKALLKATTCLFLTAELVLLMQHQGKIPKLPR